MQLNWYTVGEQRSVAVSIIGQDYIAADHFSITSSNVSILKSSACSQAPKVSSLVRASQCPLHARIQRDGLRISNSKSTERGSFAYGIGSSFRFGVWSAYLSIKEPYSTFYKVRLTQNNPQWACEGRLHE